jgi:hypothetical protein
MNSLTTWKVARAVRLAVCLTITIAANSAPALAIATQEPNSPQPQPAEKRNPAAEAPQNPNDEKPGTIESIEGATKDATVEAARRTKEAAKVTVGEMRKWEVSLFTGPYIGRGVPFAPLTRQGRVQMYLEQTWTTPNPYWKRMISAEFDLARDVPSQWGEGIGGFGERFASHEAQFVTANSVAAFLNAKLQYEPRYDECGCTGFLPRFSHAIARNFYTYDDSETNKHPQWGLYGGAFLAGMVSSSWKPGHHVLREAGYGVAGQAGYGILFDAFIEFAPEVARKLGVRKRPKPGLPPPAGD